VFGLVCNTGAGHIADRHSTDSEMHKKITIKTPYGDVPGIAPLIISASRATDIPAFHSEWFMHRLNQGYCVWINPFNKNQKTFISFSNCRIIVFWSKNPKPLMPYLDEISAHGIKYYFQYTINDYEGENLEPNVPRLYDRIETFIQLSEKIGKDKVIWRYDPIMRTNFLSLDDVLKRINRIGKKINPYTMKLVFSFVDILDYSRISYNLRKNNVDANELEKNERLYFAQELVKISSAWENKIKLATCAEFDNLLNLNITKNKCIDDVLICKICRDDEIIIREYGKYITQFSFFDNGISNSDRLKDKGQRKNCGCVPSKDIGAYNTCLHLCTYCYANHSQTAANNNFGKFSVENESLLV
jgi:hypothetical protein